jgi:hypothetical protein
MRLDKCLWPFCVSKNLTVKNGPPEDGADESRNESEYYTKSLTWCTGIAALNVGLTKTDNS